MKLKLASIQDLFLMITLFFSARYLLIKNNSPLKTSLNLFCFLPVSMSFSMDPYFFFFLALSVLEIWDCPVPALHGFFFLPLNHSCPSINILVLSVP